MLTDSRQPTWCHEACEVPKLYKAMYYACDNGLSKDQITFEYVEEITAKDEKKLAYLLEEIFLCELFVSKMWIKNVTLDE